MNSLEAHPVCEIFPLMANGAFDQLVDDIKRHGLREPIELHPDGRIVDGRNRYRASVEAGIDVDKIPAVTWDGEEEDLVAYVVSRNLHRRHLTESQRAMVAERVTNIANGGDRRSDQSANLHSGRPPISKAQAADQLKVSPRTVKHAAKVQKAGVPELQAAVEAGDASVSAAAEVANLPAADQRYAVAEGKVAETAREIKRLRKANAAPKPEPTPDPPDEEPSDGEQYVAAILRGVAAMDRMLDALRRPTEGLERVEGCRIDANTRKELLAAGQKDCLALADLVDRWKKLK